METGLGTTPLRHLVVALIALAVLSIVPIATFRDAWPPDPANGPFAVHVADGVVPRRTAADAVSITRGYLANMRSEIAAPELHMPASVTTVWAVRARDAGSIDSCIPAEASNDIVWITDGTGDYLNLRVYPWSTPYIPDDEGHAIRERCAPPAPAGIIVIADASGSILGVFPRSMLGHP